MSNGFTTPEEEAAKTAAYEAELVRRYLNKLPLSKSDTRDAKKILRRATPP